MRFPEQEESRIIVDDRLMTIVVPTKLVDGGGKEEAVIEKMSASISDTCSSEFKKENSELSLACEFSSKAAADSRHISFGKLEVRYYPIILGDHPDCSEGPPVRLLLLSTERLYMFLLLDSIIIVLTRNSLQMFL
jgi:hypothetical protein